MKRFSTFFLSALIALLALPLTASAEDVTFDFSVEGFREKVGTALTDPNGTIYNETFTSGGATFQVIAGSSASKLYKDSKRGQCLVTYKEYATLTFKAPEGKAITKIVFAAAGNSNINNFTASSGAIDGMVWTGNADGVRFLQGGTSYLANAVLTIADKTTETTTLPAIDYKECANIAAFNALKAGDYAKVTLTDAEVVGLSADGSSTAWIQDATGGCWIQYSSLIEKLAEKKKINGIVYVAKRITSGNPHMKEAEATLSSELALTDIEAYTAIVGSLADVNVAANLNKVVKVTPAYLFKTSANGAGNVVDGAEKMGVNNGGATANQQLHKIETWTNGELLLKPTITAILSAKSDKENQLLPITIEGGTKTEVNAFFDFKNNNYDHTWASGLSEDGNIAGDAIKVGDVTMTNVNGNTPTRLFNNSSRGNHLQVYKGATLLLTAAEGKAITKVQILCTNDKATKLTAREGNGTQTGNVWEGDATTVKFDNVSSTDYIDAIIVCTANKTDATFTPAALEYTEAANIAAFNAMENGSLAKLMLNNARVNGYYDSFHTYYVEDATGATEFTLLPVSLKSGDVLNGFVYVKKEYDAQNYDHKARQSEDFSKTDFAVTEGTLEGTATEIAAVGAEANVGKLFTISNTMVVKEGRFFYANDGKGAKIQVKDEMGVMTNGVAEGIYSSITGICIYNGLRWEIMPLSDDAMVKSDASFTNTFDFENNNMDLPIGKAGSYAEQSEGDLGGKFVTMSGVTLKFVNAMTMPTRYYLNGERGNQFQAINGGQLRVTAPAGYAVTSVKSVSSPGKNTATGETTYQIAWNVTKGGGSLTEGNSETQTWTGNAESVLLSSSGATYLKAIEVTVAAVNAETALLVNEEADNYTEVNGLADFAKADNNALVKLTLTDAVITSTMANNWGYYVQDASAGANFYCTGLGFNIGDKISGVVYVKKNDQNVGPRICMTEKTNADELTIAENGTYEPISGEKIADISKTENKCRIVKLSGVKVKGTSETAATVTDSDNESIAINNAASNFLANAMEGSLANIDYASATVIGILYGSSATANSIMPISITQESTDGIANVNAAKTANTVIYNLQGVRMNQLQRGLNIVNGNKVVVK